MDILYHFFTTPNILVAEGSYKKMEDIHGSL